MVFRKTLSALCLVVSSFFVLATSVADPDFLASGELIVTSDCTNPVTEMRVMVQSFQITDPPAVTFQTFGYPTTSLSSGPQTGIVGSVERLCTRTYSNGTSEAVYSCYDNGQLSCTLFIQK